MGTQNAFAYPLGYKVNHYRQARRLALASAQAAGALWEFRWGTTAGHICYINRINVNGVQIANATAEELRFSLKIARSFTAVDSNNVVSILRAGDMQQLATKEGVSVLSAFVESNSATAASGGTMTLDTDPICNGSYVTIGTASTTIDGADDVILDYNAAFEGFFPLVLRQDEGFVVSLDAQKGATTGFVVNLEVAWSECIKAT